jgi:hypothetical protein
MQNTEQAAAEVKDKYADLYRDSDTIISFATEQVLYHCYKRAKHDGDEEIIKRIEANWERLYGVPFFEAEPIPIGLLGGPGQGKTAVMVESAKRAAAIMGLNFVSDRNSTPGKNDFYFDVVTLGGALSPVLIKGTQLPDTIPFVDAEGVERTERVMNTVLPTNVTKSKYARASIILLDDAPNAHPDVLTAIYDLLKPENESAFSKIYYCYTGNTGDDGAAAKRFNTAIASRVRLMYMKDEPRDFIKRIEDTYKGDIAETYIASLCLGLIESNPDKLNTPAIKGFNEKTQFACSRTWTQFIAQSAQYLRPYAWRIDNKPDSITGEHRAKFIGQLHQLAVDNLGRDVGQTFYSHCLRVIQDADPIAREIMKHGLVTPELERRIAEQYGSGDAAKDYEFMYAMADSLSSRAAQMYAEGFNSKEPAIMQKALQGLTSGVFTAIKSPKTPEYVSHCFQRFFSGVASKTDYSRMIGYKTDKGVLTISNAFFDEVVKEASKNSIAVAEYEYQEGKKTTLLSQIGNVPSVRASKSFGGIKSGEEYNRAIEEAEAFKDVFKRFNEEAKQNAANHQSPQTQTSAPATVPVQSPSTTPAQASVPTSVAAPAPEPVAAPAPVASPSRPVLMF